ncbi:MAG: YidC/Oxa1 family membrane protein insertase [Sphingobacteriales bacterium]|jgi:YidC/Oxa1 family membrane protein insertase
MDRNTTVGLLLIGLILIGFSYFFRPSQEDIDQLKRQEDSLALAKQVDAKSKVESNADFQTEAAAIDPIVDSSALASQYGIFANAANADDREFVIENDVIKVTLSAKGGQVKKVWLKEFLTFEKEPLYLMTGDNSQLGLQFFANSNFIKTNDLFFEPLGNGFKVSGKDKKSFTLRLKADDNRYMDFVYTLTGDKYMMDFDVQLNGFQNLLPPNANYLTLDWQMDMMPQERSVKTERENSSLYFKYSGDDDVDDIAAVKSDAEELTTKVNWVSFKQHFFSASLISKEGFEDAKIEVIAPETDDVLVKNKASMTLPFNRNNRENYAMSMYLGPNNFEILEKHELGLEKQIRLGWGILGWINRFVVIPVFNFFEGFNLNYGIIILLLTIILKIVLFPLTFKSYLSAAKMRVLKPEMDEIKKKNEGQDQMKTQQETMKLYKKAGVNPLGGCIPMVMQMPILIALFYFFPASIELRQESFLWATDLSTYDSIWTFGKLPIIEFIYGDHVSLFTILMTVSTLIYTRLNNQISGATGQMKYISYIMPIFFLGFFNNYASGLTYYYFCANMITFGQQFMIRRFVDDEAIHRKIEKNRKKPGSAKKSGFQKRLEDMAKKKGYNPPS